MDAVRQPVDRARLTRVAAALVLVTLAVFWPVFDNGFVSYDDYLYVTDNPHVKTGLSGANVAWAFTSARASNWHPLTWISHMLDVQLYGLGPRGHHATGLLLHLANVVLLLLFLVRTTRRLWPAALVAGLFALHPLHVESVAWVAERKDVLSTFFWFLTLLAYVRYVERPGPGRYAQVFALLALGLMAKPMLVTVPLVLLLLDYWPLARERSWQQLVWEKLPLFALSAASSVVTYLVQQAGGSVGGSEAYPWSVRAGNAVVATAAYLVKLVAPVNLAVFYPHPQESLPAWKIAGSILLLVAISFLAVRQAARRPHFIAGWLWYLITLLPVVGLVQVGRQAMADRYTYVPLIGIFVAVAWSVAELLQRRTGPGTGRAERRRTVASKGAGTLSAEIPLAYLAIPALVLAPLTAVQVRTWKDSETLFAHAARVTRDNYVALTNLGEVQNSRGQTESAAGNFREALRIQPESAEAANNLANLLVKQRNFEEALRWLTVAVRNKPESPEVHFNLGLALVGVGRVDEGIEHYREALRRRPDYVDVRDSLALELDRQGRFEEALREFAEAIRLNPNRAETYNNQGTVLLGRQRLDEALASFRTAARIKPELPQTHNNLAAVHFFKGDYAEAWREIALCRRYGLEPSPALVQPLSQKMPEPPR